LLCVVVEAVVVEEARLATPGDPPPPPQPDTSSASATPATGRTRKIGRLQRFMLGSFDDPWATADQE
jgi:hypothetical protein